MGATETLADGLVYMEGSSTADSTESPGDHQYQFTRIGNSDIAYQVTTPETEGTCTISGTFTDGMKNTGTIGGDTVIDVSDVIRRYTDPGTGEVEKTGAVQAVNDYLFNDVLSRDDAVTVVNAYLFG